MMDTLLVPASFDCLGQVREFILTSALNAGLSSKAAYRLQLGVDEILTNIIEYGYEGCDGKQLVGITVKEDDDSVYVVLEDRGRPFDPRRHVITGDFDAPLEMRDPGGLGIFLSMTSLDDLLYAREDDRNRITCVINKDIMRGEKRAECLLIVGILPSPAIPLLETIKSAGYIVTTAGTAGHALSKLFGRQYDAALLSLHIPDMPIEALLEQWAANGLTLEMPVCVATSANELSRAEACLRYGVADILIYDAYSPNLWRHHLANALQRRQAQAEVASSRKQLAVLQKLADDLTQIILPVGIALSRIKNFDRLLEKILRETKTVCNADGGTLYLRDGDTLTFAIMLNDSLGIAVNQKTDKHDVPAPLPLHDAETGLPNYESVATSSALSGTSINIPDIYHVSDFDFSGSHAFDVASGYRSMSMLTVPLKDHEGDVFGVLQLLNAQDSDTGEVIPFTDYMQQAAEALASIASLVLSNRLLLERQKELLRMEEELHIGRQIQTSFLPLNIPTIPGWEIAVSLQPAQEISGDFYDIFPLNENQRLGFVIADVCDKGVGAALVMVLIRTLIRAFVEYSADSASSVRSVLELTNRYILKNHAQTTMFASLFIGMLNPYSGKLAYVNSGHPAPVILNANGIRDELEPTGPVIGAFSDSTFEVRQATLEPGETIFAFTDGVTDARDHAGNYFTRERLLDLLRHFAETPVRGLLAHINAEVQRYTSGTEQFDDTTMIAIRRLP